MTSEDQKNVIRKIKGLMAKANGTENEHEAALFAAKAQELLAQYNLEQSDLADKELSEFTEQTIEWNYLSPLWRRLHDAVGALYFCKMYWKGEIVTTRKGAKFAKRMRYAGREHNVEIAIDMADYLRRTVVRLAKAHSGMRSDQIEFERGCILGLTKRVRDLIPRQNSVVPNGDRSLPALYAAENKAVEEWIASSVGKIKAVANKAKVANSDSAAAGFQAAKSISINNQVAGARPGVKLIG